MLYFRGDLVEATEDYIMHQCNCISVRPHGLSKTIASSLGSEYDVYARRRPIGRRNCCIEADRPEPGTALILRDRVICLFGQYGMGRPFSSNNRNRDLHPGDTHAQREAWFASALVDAARQIPETATVAAPYGIGCGLAQGRWSTYERLLLESPLADRLTLYRLTLYRQE